MFVFTESKQTSHPHWSFPLISLSLSLIIKYILGYYLSLFLTGPPSWHTKQKHLQNIEFDTAAYFHLDWGYF